VKPEPEPSQRGPKGLFGRAAAPKKSSGSASFGGAAFLTELKPY
jgi:hypothetical protein